MLIKACDMQTVTRERPRGGSGKMDVLDIVPAQMLPAKSRLFSIMSLGKGCGIGAHDHATETEIYYVLEGEGVLDDNGTQLPFKKGDCSVCGGGAYHAIRNERDETLRVLAVIILD